MMTKDTNFEKESQLVEHHRERKPDSKDTTIDMGVMKIPRKLKTSSENTNNPSNCKNGKRDIDSLYGGTTEKTNDGPLQRPFDRGCANPTRNGHSSSKEWMYCAPTERQPHKMSKDGKVYFWCAKCNSGKGIWTFHPSVKHVDVWKPPKEGEPQQMFMDGKEWYWCQKCKNGKGIWGGHPTIDHKDTKRDLMLNNTKLKSGESREKAPKKDTTGGIFRSTTQQANKIGISINPDLKVSFPSIASKHGRRSHVSLKDKLKTIGKSARALKPKVIKHNKINKFYCPLKRIEQLRSTPGYVYKQNKPSMKQMMNHTKLKSSLTTTSLTSKHKTGDNSSKAKETSTMNLSVDKISKDEGATSILVADNIEPIDNTEQTENILEGEKYNESLNSSDDESVQVRTNPLTNRDDNDIDKDFDDCEDNDVSGSIQNKQTLLESSSEMEISSYDSINIDRINDENVGDKSSPIAGNYDDSLNNSGIETYDTNSGKSPAKLSGTVIIDQSIANVIGAQDTDLETFQTKFDSNSDSNEQIGSSQANGTNGTNSDAAAIATELSNTPHRNHIGREAPLISHDKSISKVAANENSKTITSEESEINNSDNMTLSSTTEISDRENSLSEDSKKVINLPLQSTTTSKKEIPMLNTANRSLRRRSPCEKKLLSLQDRSRGRNEEISASERIWLDTKLELTAKEFLKSTGVYSVDKILSTSASKLNRMYKQWRLDYKYKPIPSTISCVARWQGLAKMYKIENGDDSSEETVSLEKLVKDSYSMYVVPHLTRTIVGGGDLPIRYITVMNIHETLFDFRINIRTSKIPNSGYGAFLTFLGARKLKEGPKKWSQDLLLNRFIVESLTKEPLEATIDNRSASISLLGKDLHGNGNSNFFSVTRFPLEANLNNKKVSVKIVPNSAHDSVQQLRDNNEIPSPKDGLGHLEMFTEDDYEADDTIKFCSKDAGCIDLGRYGPFLKTDRKTIQEFNLKDFLFDFEPAAWNFGVEEKLKGCTQLVDVTDDCTGEPHRLAKDNIPMYVNEVGHDKKLKQNVLARDIDDRVVHYYFFQRDQMFKGDTVELLVNYGDGYEGTRERKGYGLANIKNHLQCDQVNTAKLKRNHADRNSIREMIESMTFMEIKNSLEFLEDRIIGPLVQYTDVYFSNLIAKSAGKEIEELVIQRKVTDRQLVARFRLSWIGELFRSQIDRLLGNRSLKLDRNDTRKLYNIIHPKRLDPRPFFKGSPNLHKFSKISEMYILERFEDVLLRISHEYGLSHAYEPSLWCRLARDLCEELVKIIVHEGYDQDSPRSQRRLALSIYKIATSAATTLKKSCNLLSTCATPQEITKSHRLLGFVRTDNEVINSHLQSLLPNHSENIHIHLLESGSSAGTSNHPVALANSLEVMCVSMAPEVYYQNKQNKMPLILRCLSTTKTFDSSDCNKVFKNGKVKVDEKWYLLWQVIRVIHIISINCVSWSSHEYYSLEDLCSKVGVNVNDAQLMLAVKMAQPFKAIYSHKDETLEHDHIESLPVKKGDTIPEPICKQEQKQTQKTQYENTCKKESKLIQVKTAAVLNRSKSGPLYEEKDGTVPSGWRVQYIERLSSKHVDRYWYTKTNKKLRSRVEVKLFLDLIKRCNGDEESAWEMFPGSRKPRNRPKLSSHNLQNNKG